MEIYILRCCFAFARWANLCFVPNRI